MTVRATKRGAERTPLAPDWDVVICGASFAGLAVARELAGCRVAPAGRPARVLLVDRYEIGERQTSACAVPTVWFEHLGLTAAIRQTFGELVLHTSSEHLRWTLPWTFSTFDYREACRLLAAQNDAVFETAKVEGRTTEPDGTITVHTDRGDLRAPLVVDALGWRRILGTGPNVQPPDALLSRGLEVHPAAWRPDLELWLDPRYVPAGYGWSFPAGDEVRVGVGSFDPRRHVKEPTLRLAGDVGVPPGGYQGNWIPHAMRDPVQDGVFFAGDSAGHCYPTTAEGIRPALYYGRLCGSELRMVLEGRQVRTQALDRYAQWCEEDRWAFRTMLAIQRLVGRLIPHQRLTGAILRLLDRPGFVRWSFGRYLRLTPLPAPSADRPRVAVLAGRGVRGRELVAQPGQDGVEILQEQVDHVA